MQPAIAVCSAFGFLVTACAATSTGPDPAPAGAEAAAAPLCDPAQPFDCVKKGRAHQWGKGVEKNPAQARAAFAHGCDGGNLNACMALGAFLRQAGEPAAALAALDAACDGGYLFACVHAGNLYIGNAGMGRDYAKARAYYERACQDMRRLEPPPMKLEFTVGQAYGCDNLGMLYENAWGVERNRGRTFELAAFACAHGWGNGCNQVGVFIGRGWAPGEHAEDEQLDWYRKACELNDGNGCCNAAIYLHREQTTTEDGQDAADYLERAEKVHWNCKLPD